MNFDVHSIEMHFRKVTFIYLFSFPFLNTESFCFFPPVLLILNCVLCLTEIIAHLLDIKCYEASGRGSASWNREMDGAFVRPCKNYARYKSKQLS